MVPDLADDKTLLAVQKKSQFNGALYLFLGLVFHCVVTGTLIPPLVSFQLLAVGIFVMLGVSIGQGWLSPNHAGIVGSILGLLCATAFVYWSGGPASPYIQLFGALPFMLALFTPGSSMPTFISGGAALVTMLAVSLMYDVPPRMVLLQAICNLVLLSLALFGMRIYQRLIHEQREAHRARLLALEQLAESERLRGRAERERAEVERLVLVGQLAAGVAHEVNNPLAFVKANLHFLESELYDEARPLDRGDLKELLQETQQGVLRIQQIVMDLKDFSRTGQLGEQERGVLEEALREAVRLASVRQGAGSEVSLRLAPDLPTVRLGQRHIVQVILNLLLNAVDAVEQARPERRAHITVSARRMENGVDVWVEDNGPGIPPEVLPRLFEPFFTTKPPGKGTGLGLALCREYVTRAGGSLHAENRSEGGARFVLSLPQA